MLRAATPSTSPPASSAGTVSCYANGFLVAAAIAALLRGGAVIALPSFQACARDAFLDPLRAALRTPNGAKLGRLLPESDPAAPILAT